MEPQPSDPSQNGWFAALSLGESVWSWLPHVITLLWLLCFAIIKWDSARIQAFWKTSWPALREFGILRVIALVWFLIYAGILVNSDMLCQFTNPFVQNYIVEMYAALLIISGTFCFRNYIKRFLDRLFSPTPVRVRLPLMTATAPIILGLDRHIWREYGIDLMLDWRYAGRNALDNLVHRECDIAIAADYAVVKFLSDRDNGNEDLAVLPFVVITDHLRIVRRHQDSAAAQPDIPEGPIAYYENSVHEDFLQSVGRNICDSDPKATSVLHGLWKLFPDCVDRADGLLLWEPHYAAFEGATDFQVSSAGTGGKQYTWLLCLVARHAYLEAEPRLATGIYDALKKACALCNETDEVVEACRKYFPEEFLGIDRPKLRSVVEQQPRHIFDIEIALARMQEKLRKWDNTHQWGAGNLDRLLREKKIWPGVPLEVPCKPSPTEEPFITNWATDS